MPILGNLSEFPLPEVLLLIGTRTGRLRLLDVPEFGMMEIDFSNGEAQTLYLGNNALTESDDLVGKLGAVVQAKGGMFEFRLQPVASVPRDNPLMVNQLVLSLVCHVDEQIAKGRAPVASRHRYLLEQPEPEIWIEPELRAFLIDARRFLTAPGIHLDDLARHMSLDVESAYRNLTNLWLVGVVKLIDEEDAVQIETLQVEEEISRKSNEFLRASRAVSELQRRSDKLPKVKAQGV